MKIKLSILFVSLFIINACKEKSENLRLVNFEEHAVHINISSDFEATYYLSRHFDGKLYGFNSKYGKIDVFDFKDVKASPTAIVLEKSPQAETQNILDFQINSEYIATIDSNGKVLIFDTKGKYLKSHKLSDTTKDWAFLQGFNVNQPQLTYINSEYFFIPLMANAAKNDKKYFQQFAILKISLNSEQHEILVYDFPEFIRQNPLHWPLHDFLFITETEKNELLVSFHFTSLLAKYNSPPSGKEFEADLSAIPLPSHVKGVERNKSIGEIMMDENYIFGSPRYFGLNFDANNKLFYRYVKGESDGSTVLGENNYVLFYDTKLNLQKYLKLPKGIQANIWMHNGTLYGMKAASFLKNEGQLQLVSLDMVDFD